MAETYAVEAVLRARTDGFERGFQAAAQAARDFQRAADSVSTKGIEKAGRQFQTAGRNIQAAGKQIAGVGAGLTAAVTAPLVAMGAGAVKAAVEWESAFAGVRKTVDGSEADFKKLEQGIIDMSKEIPASAEAIAGVAEAAGQLGIEKDSILGFTKTMIDLGESTNLTADEAATSMARFANITQMSQKEFSRLGSTVVALGNNFATTEAEIVEMSQRLAAQGAQVGMSESQIMALSAAMSSVGINAEAGGTAMTIVLKKIQSAVGENGKELAGWAKLSGVSASEFKTAFEQDAAGALNMVIQGLGNASAEGANMAEMLTDLGVKGIYESDTLMRLAGAGDLVTEAFDTANTAWSENTALSDEASQRYATMASQFQILQNTVKAVARDFGALLAPAITRAMEIAKALVGRFSGMSDTMKLVIVVVAAVAAALGPVVTVIGLLVMAAGSLVGNFGVLVSRFPQLASGFTGVGRAISLLFGPVGILIATLLSLIPVFIRLYQENETFRAGVQTVWAAIQSVIQSVVSAVVSFVMSLWGQLSSFWQENGAIIQQATQNVWNVIKTVIQSAMAVISSVFTAVWPALQIIVRVVWDVIKGVIQGALNIIMGLVRTFSGLFTGNWSAMWSGVKQLFSGALQFVWNLLQLTFMGRMLGAVRTFAGLLRGGISSMWATVRSTFSTALNAIRSFFSNAFNNMKNIANTSMSTIGSTISRIWNTIKSFFFSSLSSILSTVRSKFLQMVSVIRSALTTAVSTVRSMITNMITAVKSGASRMLSAGKDLIRGLINGIKNMGAAAIGAIAGVVDGVINKAKSLLKIKSPSRVFQAVGAHSSEGLATGSSLTPIRISHKTGVNILKTINDVEGICGAWA